MAADPTKGFRSAAHRDLARDALAAGVRYRDTGTHLVLYPPDGSRPVVLSRTAYDGQHGTVTARAALRRGGAKIP